MPQENIGEGRKWIYENKWENSDGKENVNWTTVTVEKLEAYNRYKKRMENSKGRTQGCKERETEYRFGRKLSQGFEIIVRVYITLYNIIIMLCITTMSWKVSYKTNL